MQSIEQIRRTNELSKVLRTHGLANDNFDAMQQASAMTTDDSSQIFEVQHDSEALQKVRNLERSKHLTNGRIDELQLQIESLNSYIKDLHQRFAAMETSVKNMRHAPAMAPVAEPAPIVAASAPATPAFVEPAPAAPTRQPTPDRNGFSPADVSIDKIFYCGKR